MIFNGTFSGNIYLRYIIGLHRVGRSTDFVWIDGTPLGYSNWFRDEPNGQNTSEDCAELRYNNNFDHAWNDVACNKAYWSLLCQRPAGRFVFSILQFHSTILFYTASFTSTQG